MHYIILCYILSKLSKRIYVKIYIIDSICIITFSIELIGHIIEGILIDIC